MTKDRTRTTTFLEIPVPLGGEGFARISIPAHMSAQAWDQLLNVLCAYKSGIVYDNEDLPRGVPS